ncbi:MAG: peptidylprolyl isomerase [Geminicoccaceae bacterium]|nr:peptidylprolyl isomerase [Geminicoccaceae bacterium]
MPWITSLLWSLVLAMTLTGAAHGQDLENTLYMDLEDGRVVIELRPDLAPKHVARIKELVREGFYDGIVFHRVIPGFMAQTGDPTGTGRGGSVPGFMAQTGDPTGTGRGGSDKPDLPAEFSNEPFERGTLGMARTSDPNSANSQFFINFAPTPHLNGQYTVWGQVVEGMDYIDQIAKGEPPSQPDRIVKMSVAADAGG